MAVSTAGEKGGRKSSFFSRDGSVLGLLIKVVGLSAVVGLLTYTGWVLLQDGNYAFSAAFFITALLFTLVFVRQSTVPLRWIMPGLVFLILFQLYPIFFTVYTAFTNYSTGRNIERPAAIAAIERLTYVPEGSPAWGWTPLQGDDGSAAVWIIDPADGTAYLALPGEELIPAAEVEGLQLDESGAPVNMDGFTVQANNQRFLFVSANQGVTFGDEERGVQVTTSTEARQTRQRYVYDPDQNAMIDQQDGTVFVNQEGIFTAEDGRTLAPGHPVWVGLENFTSILTNPAIRGPFFTIFTWTFIWAFLSVLETFVLGMILALNMNSPNIPFQRLLRVLLIVPYAIPPFITVKVWVGLLNPVLGVIGSVWNPGWFTDPFWAKVGILMVNLWLGFPYMFLIITGALQSIPGDIYEAARVDGAGPLYQFRRLTLPLLMVSIGPLLIGSFAFNFNNFAIIDLYNAGGPPIPGSATPAGYTDILISYTYRIAFGGARGNDYGLAAAISIIIFIIVATITILNFRFTGQLEEVSENV
jgi:ABC-type sugar transport system permease subunit